MSLAEIFAAVRADSAPTVPADRNTRCAASFNNLREAFALTVHLTAAARAAEIARVCRAA